MYSLEILGAARMCTHLRYLVHGNLYSLKIPGTQICTHLRYLVRKCTHYGSEYTWDVGWSKVSA